MGEIEDRKSKFGIGRGIVFAAIIILVVIIVVFFGQYFSAAMEGKTREIGLQEKHLSDQVQSLEAKTSQLQRELQDLHHEMAQLKINAVNAAGWNFSIVEHLLNLAQLTLNTSGDTKMAEVLLISTKRYVGDPLLAQISQALDRDLTKLKTIDTDTAIILPHLAKLKKQVDGLSLLREDDADKLLINKPVITVRKEKDTRWQRFFSTIITELRQLLVVRYEPTIPVLSRTQEDSLRLHLQTKLLQVELAVLQKNRDFYRRYLEEIISLVEQYFILHAPTANGIIAQLRELEEVSFGVSDSLGDSYSLESVVAVKNFISQRHGVQNGSK